MALTKKEQEELELLELEEQEAAHLASLQDKPEEKDSGITKEDVLKAAYYMANPSAYLSKKFAETDPITALEGIGEGVSQGYLNNVQAATEKPVFALMNTLTDQNVEADDYLKARDYYNERQEKLKKENPGSFYSGQIAGTVMAGSPIASLAKSATAGGRILKSGLIGAAQGLMQNTSEEKGQMDYGLNSERFKNAGFGAAFGLGVTGALEGYAARDLIKNKTLDFLSVKNATLKQNADEIVKASEKLGVKPTASMLQNSEELARLEDAVASDPIFGRKLAEQKSDVYKGIQQGIESATQSRTGLSPYEVGEKFKSNIAAKVGETFDQPVSLFERVAKDTQHIPLSPKSIQTVQRNIENIPGIGLSKRALSYASELENLKNANDVKTLMTNLNADIGSATGSDLIALSKIKPKLQNLEKNSITRAAIEMAATPKAGEKTAQEILSELSAARKGYASGMKDIGEISSIGRMGQPASPMNFIDKLESIASEKIPQKFYNVGDYGSIQKLSQLAPEEAELLRQSRLADIYNQSFNGENISAANFLRQTNKIQPEVLQATFKEATPTVGAIETMTNALPKNYNPSGTAAKLQLTDIDPRKILGGAYNYARYSATGAPRNPNINISVPENISYLGQLFNVQQPQVEQPTERAERINQERKSLKGK